MGYEKKSITKFNLKKYLSAIMVIILVCLSTTTGKTVQAEVLEQDNVEACKATFMNFSDQRVYPASSVEVKTTTGSAITVGGRKKWDYGFIIIEPQNEYSVENIYSIVRENGNETVKNFELSTVESVCGKVTGVDIPNDVANVLNSTDRSTPAVFISRSDYLNICYQTLYISLVNQEGSHQVIEARIESDEISLSPLTLALEESFDIFEHPSLKQILSEEGLLVSDFSVNMSAINSTPNDAVIKEENSAKYIAKKTGIVKFRLESKIDGRRFEFLVYITIGDGPIKDDQITLSSNARLDTRNSSQGMYNIYPSDTNTMALKELSMEFNLPEGAVIDWSKTNIDGTVLVENSSINYQVPFSDNVTMCVEHKKVDGEQFLFSSEYALRGTLNLTVNYNGKDYTYTFMIVRNSFMAMRGDQTYYIAPYKKDSIFSYILFFGSEQEVEVRKQQFLDNVTSGRYKVSMPGAELVFENGKFNGNIIFYHPGSYLSVYDNELRLTIQSGDMDVKCIMSTAVKSGANFDLASFMNGYWNNSYEVELVNNTQFQYDEHTHIVTAPINDTDTIIQQRIILKLNGKPQAEFKMVVCPEKRYDEVLKDVVRDVAENESLVLDMQNSEPVISKDVIEALKSDAEKYLVIKNSSSTNEVEWKFKSQDIVNEIAKDLELKVTVNEIVDENIDKILQKENADGIKIGFEDNGILPGKASVRIYLSQDEVEKLGKREGIQLYYYNPEKGEMELEASGLRIQEDKNQGNKFYIEMNVYHNSNFVLSTSSDLEPTVPPTTEPTVPPTTEPTVPPMTEPTVPSTIEPTVPSDEVKGITIKEDKMEIGASCLEYETNISKKTISTMIKLTEEQEKCVESYAQKKVIVVFDWDEKELKEQLQKNPSVQAYKVIVDTSHLSNLENATYVIPKNVIITLKEANVDMTISVNGTTSYSLKIKAEQMAKVKEDISVSASITESENSSNIAFDCESDNNILATLSFDVSNITEASTEYVYVYKVNRANGKYEEIPNFKKTVSKNGTITLIAESNEDYYTVTEVLKDNVIRLVDTVSMKAPKSMKVGSEKQINAVMPDELSLVKKFDKSGDPYGTEEVKVKYSVNNKSIAEIDSTGKLTAKRAGKVQVNITVQLENGDKKVITKTITIK